MLPKERKTSERTGKQGKETVKQDKEGEKRISFPEVSVMTGHIVPGEGNRFLVRLSRERMLGLPLLRGEVPGRTMTPRQVRRTARALRRAGVTRLLAPEGFPFWEEAAGQGLRPVETGELCRALAVPIAMAALDGDGIPHERASVVLYGERVTRALRAAALELCPQVRQLLIEVPAGGERLQRELSWEFGLPVIEPAAVRSADLRLCFSSGGTDRIGREVDLSGDTPALGDYWFGLQEKTLPTDAAALSLLAALWNSGRLERDEITVKAHFRT